MTANVPYPDGICFDETCGGSRKSYRLETNHATTRSPSKAISLACRYDHFFAAPNRRNSTIPVIRHENIATIANVFCVVSVSFVAT